MEICIEKQLINIVYSVILGLIFGGIYDIIRITQVLCRVVSYSGAKGSGYCVMKKGKPAAVVFAVTDSLFMLSVCVIFSLFTYAADNGHFRMFMLVAALCGFVLYYNTLGRLVMLVSDAIARFLVKAFRTVILIPLMWVLRLLGRAFGFVMRKTIGVVYRAAANDIMRRRAKRFLSQLGWDIAFPEIDLKE